jgi:amino acid transporter
LGLLIALAGTAVYVEFGMAIPRFVKGKRHAPNWVPMMLNTPLDRNGGEKNYLEYVFKRPRFLATAMYASYALLLAWSAGNSVVFGEYVLHATGIEVGRWNQRGIGLACITAAFLIHATAVKWGLRLQNALGVVKLVIILMIVICGISVMTGRIKVQDPGNLDSPWEGNPPTVYGVVMALYSVIWSYTGYSNANYVCPVLSRYVSF